MSYAGRKAMKVYKKCMNKLDTNIRKLDKTISDLKDLSLTLRIPEQKDILD